MPDYKSEYRKWLDSPSLDSDQWMELDSIKEDAEEIRSRFSAPLSFGTAGLRGLMGMGTARINVHTVRQATQGFANVLKRDAAKASKGIVIAYDCRNNSKRFAKEAACVMAGNGIHVYLFDELRPTPELSFAIRRLGAAGGINITASHNTKEYNGYKVYGSDGAQLTPEDAQRISEQIMATDVFSGIVKMHYSAAVTQGLIEIIGESIDEEFLQNVIKCSIEPELIQKADDMKIVYTPFHGTGYRLVPEALRRLGVKELFPVPEQMVVNGDFTTVKSPNPEEEESFALAVSLAEKVGAQLIIGTDPDADRVGVMVPDGKGGYSHITGNQMGVLLLDYILEARRRKGTLPSNAAALKTIVTTELARIVAETNGVAMEDTFTGFKFIAEKIAEYEKSRSREIIFAFEESYGYLIGDFVRDKDAVSASVLIAEMAAWYHLHGKTLIDAMLGIYEKYGWFAESTVSLAVTGADGPENMARIMQELRREPPEKIGGHEVEKVRDYLSGKIIGKRIQKREKTPIQGADVLLFELADGITFIVRPSGTEPKIKFYIMAKGDSEKDCTQKIADCAGFVNGLK